MTVFIVAGLGSMAGAVRLQPIVATTDDPQIVETSSNGAAFALTETDYRAQATQLASNPAFVPMTKKPAGLSSRARFGVNFGFEEQIRSWAIGGDGTFDPEIERYVLSEKFVNIGDRTYEFAIDRYGRTVTFTPLAEKRPGRAVLKTGYPAPDFQFVDLTGKTRRLSDLRGRVVLLDFWGVWCSSCVAMVPELVALYGKYHARGFEILGIEANDSREKVTAFVAGRHMPWTQTLETDTGPITTLYRVAGWPTSFLVGPDGKFLAANYVGEVDVRVELKKFFRD